MCRSGRTATLLKSHLFDDNFIRRILNIGSGTPDFGSGKMLNQEVLIVNFKTLVRPIFYTMPYASTYSRSIVNDHGDLFFERGGRGVIGTAQKRDKKNDG